MLNLYVMEPRVGLDQLGGLGVSYQAAQFAHLERHANVVWLDDRRCRWGGRISECESSVGQPADAILVFDERTLLTSPAVRTTRFDTDALLVYIAHDFWCHPMRVAQDLAGRSRVLMVLRHESSRRLFDLLLPGTPKFVQRPGVETSIFRPGEVPGRYINDIILSGSETPDYPMRRRLNRLVRQNAAARGWKVLDLAAPGIGSVSKGAQLSYAGALAASKVSVTASNRGGARPAALVMQYLDPSPARAELQDPFYGLGTPDIRTLHFETAGITPRYLESMACRSLLVADLPASDRQEFYRDKMVVIEDAMSDSEIVALLDHWVHADAEREAVVDRAYAAVRSGESSEHRARELAQLIAVHARARPVTSVSATPCLEI